MRDWDRNGKIDGRDYYLFHEEIIKDHSESDGESIYIPVRSSDPRANNKTNNSNPNKKKQKEIGCLPILLINVILLILLEFLKTI